MMRRIAHPSADPQHHVVIIGGGFGGLYAAKSLDTAPVRITVIDKRNFHLFQPLLYQVATGGLSPGDIAAPLRSALRRQRNTQVLLGEVTDIDAGARRVLMGDAFVEYDSLIVAAGCTHSYFGRPEWQKLSPGLKTLEDATEIRRRILSAFEAAEMEDDPEIRRQWLTFLIIGGGPTGVELAGALGEIANETLRGDFRRIRSEEAQILLLDAGKRVLSAYMESLSGKAERSLIRLGVRTRTGVRVTGIDETGVTLNQTERIGTRTVLWAAGVEAVPLAKILAGRAGVEADRSGRLMVESDLSLKGHPEIFVIGDMAHVEQDGQMVPGVAPAAMQMGRYAARRVRERAEGRAGGAGFRYFEKGNLAVIGRASAVAQFGTFGFGGIVAWLAWLFIHLMYLVGFQNRVVVFIQWGFQYLTFNRGARIITKAAAIPRDAAGGVS